MSNFMKFHPVEAVLFHADRLTDLMQLIVAFCSSVKATEN